MTVNISKPALNLREEIATKRNQSKYSQVQFWFTGDAALTAFTLPDGWKPLHVYNSGSLQKEGVSDEYQVSNTDGTYTVTFAVAPANANDIGVIGVIA